MRLCCNSFEEFKNQVIEGNCQIVMFGAGAIGQVTTPEILNDLELLSYVECYLDNSEAKWGTFIEACGKSFEVKAPDYLESCADSTVILLNISRFPDVIRQLEGMSCTRNMKCFVMPMMLIHNFCSERSKGKVILTDEPLIPKKLHYMWLGRKPLPDNLKKCIGSWRKYCPDYEIIEWNEDNYDISKHPYMEQAYQAGAYGFVPDYARIDILYTEGGFYLDTDVEIQRSIDCLRYQRAFCGVEKWQIINFGGLSGSVKGNPMLKEFLDEREKIYFLNEDGTQNKNTCGFYDTRVALKHGYKINGESQTVGDINIYASDYFQPYDYMSGIINETENTYSVHWFSGGWLDEKMKKANEEAKKVYLQLYHKALNSRNREGNTEDRITDDLNHLVLEPEFFHTVQTFYEIQMWGARNHKNAPREGLLIREMLKGNVIWENFTDNGMRVSRERLDQIHQKIGYLIAHNFPQLAALCTIPVYVVFDHADDQHNGLYRLATFSLA